MIIFPAIDLYEGKAVRLFKGDYAKKTVYSENPASVAEDFRAQGATHIHLVDLEGARFGETPNFETVREIKRSSGLFTEVGGGVRSLQVIEKYLNSGIDRVILSTAAICDAGFLSEAVKAFGDGIAVGIDVKDGFVAIKGWTEKSGKTLLGFTEEAVNAGVKTVICTDISKDGAMRGTNAELYKTLAERFDVDIIASGGVSSYDDIKALRTLGLYGAIIGKAYYTGDINIKKAIETAK